MLCVATGILSTSHCKTVEYSRIHFSSQLIVFGTILLHFEINVPKIRKMHAYWIRALLKRKLRKNNISNHWSFLEKEGETFSTERIYSLSTQFFHCFSTRSEAECGNFVEIEWKIGVEIFSPGFSIKRKLVIDLSISFNLWSITPTDLSGGVSRGGFCTERSGVRKTPPWWGFLRGEAP